MKDLPHPSQWVHQAVKEHLNPNLNGEDVSFSYFTKGGTPQVEEMMWRNRVNKKILI